MTTLNDHNHNRPAPPESDWLGIEFLGAVGNGEVILYKDFGDDWQFGIVRSPGTKLCSVYSEVSRQGVPSVLYATSPLLVGRFAFRVARPEEYAGVEFSYGYTPGTARH